MSTLNNVLLKCKLLNFYVLQPINSRQPISQWHIPDVLSDLRLHHGYGLQIVFLPLLTQAVNRKVSFLFREPSVPVPHCVLSIFYRPLLSLNDTLILFFNNIYDTCHFNYCLSLFRPLVTNFLSGMVDGLFDILCYYNAEYNGYAC